MGGLRLRICPIGKTYTENTMNYFSISLTPISTVYICTEFTLANAFRVKLLIIFTLARTKHIRLIALPDEIILWHCGTEHTVDRYGRRRYSCCYCETATQQKCVVYYYKINIETQQPYSLLCNLPLQRH